MVKGLSNNFVKVMNVRGWTMCLVAAMALMLCLSGNESAQATTGGSPYEVPQVKNGSSAANTIETWIVAGEATVDIGNGVLAKNAMTFKSCSDATLRNCTPASIPGPEFRLTVGNRVKVHFVNKLKKSGLTPEANVSGIHWHGIELNNASDGTELTQHAVDPQGGTFDYDFIVTRPGIFWYHPHHHSSTNQVAKGLYGSIIVAHPGEAPLVGTVLPSAEQTKTLVLSDITVCDKPGTNPATFDSTLPHVSGVSAWAINYSNHVLTQSPKILCDTEPLDANGEYVKHPYQKGEIPNVQEPGSNGRMSEGFTVLTNGVNVGGRTGNPHVVGPLGELAPGAPTPLNIKAGQGLRLQIVNPSPVRYMRLRLTNSMGGQIPLFRIGGEGGLLNQVVLEGGLVGGFDFKYGQGEILLPPAGRADVVAKIPELGGDVTENSVLTLWTVDSERVAATYSWLPTVPVMHLKVTGPGPTYLIENGQALGVFVKELELGTPEDVLVDPDGETPYEEGGLAGLVDKDIKLTFFNKTGDFQASINEVPMPRDFTGLDGGGNPFYLESARHAALSNVIELTVTNMTGTNHPFHLHGFSFQPKSLTISDGPNYTAFPLEFRDIVDVPAHYTLKFRVSLDGRPLKGDSRGVDGGRGRWLFHCHILPHAKFGMMSELHVH